MNISFYFKKYGFELETHELQSFEKFLELFITYNAHTNLSAIRDEEGIIVKHFIDSLYGVELMTQLFPHLHQLRVLDIGSGG